MKRLLLLILVLVLVTIQFIHPAKNQVLTYTSDHIESKYTIPADVHEILQKACYDCHSNYTHYPWYSKVQPVDWWLNDHVVEGKLELNFSEFGTYPLKKQAGKLKKAAKEVEKGDMPLSSYTWVHRDAVLTDAERQVFTTWARNLSLQLSGMVAGDDQK